MSKKDRRIGNLAESGLGLTHPIITERSRSNLFSSWSLRFKYSSISSPAYFPGDRQFEGSLPDFSFPIAFLSWCLSADIVEKYTQRLVSFWSCNFVPPVTISAGLAFKETAVSSLNKSLEHWVRSSNFNSTGPLIEKLNDFQPASIVGSLEIKFAGDSIILRTASRLGRWSGLVWRSFEIYQTGANLWVKIKSSFESLH